MKDHIQLQYIFLSDKSNHPFLDSPYTKNTDFNVVTSRGFGDWLNQDGDCQTVYMESPQPRYVVQETYGLVPY
jgi:hypothetical protein